MINEWMKKATDNLINTTISTSDADAQTDLVLANAVYFNGAWLEPFHSNNTAPRAFHRLNGSCTKAEVQGPQELPYKPGREEDETGAGPPARGQLKRRCGPSGTSATAKATDSADAGGDTQVLHVHLSPGRARDGVATMVDVVTAAPAFMYGMLAEMKEELVELELPRFEITFNWRGLDAALCRLGLSLPFSRKASGLRDM
ncbi:putative serpin-Z8 [Phragmites australis]|uniref:putative serpin-Z8 n=1 Tax=Phragmites australis TaxID=29695 RepID=UPI002D764FB3|nr:putative serpin-Z8 [Phragmites australis]